MINFNRLAGLRETLAVLSQLIDYPTADTFSPANRKQIEDDGELTQEEKGQLLSLFDQLAKASLLDQQTDYTNLFEMNRRYTLYMSYYKMTDSRERGTVLAKLKMLYEMFGVSEATSELSDYLPLLLDFLACGDYLGDPRRDDLQLALSVIEDGTYNLLKNAIVDSDKPYIKLIKLTRTIIGSCVKAEVKADA
ncbi:nitrate reductase molybdenum cofactor assembly chaperone [Limosilactobacillus caccae]|uniref:nitrate reductase molybdenum cofactor assembly chaperone n=1 Tax=Limosilactobacillus caccae TaxID=1926284 RepID=UPI0009705870|nr:nitrate reductase molybdenum cofactor assembly chaperone [Limosilactobacillus caccae]